MLEGQGGKETIRAASDAIEGQHIVEYNEDEFHLQVDAQEISSEVGKTCGNRTNYVSLEIL